MCVKYLPVRHESQKENEKGAPSFSGRPHLILENSYVFEQRALERLKGHRCCCWKRRAFPVLSRLRPQQNLIVANGWRISFGGATAVVPTIVHRRSNTWLRFANG